MGERSPRSRTAAATITPNAEFNFWVDPEAAGPCALGHPDHDLAPQRLAEDGP